MMFDKFGNCCHPKRKTNTTSTRNKHTIQDATKADTRSKLKMVETEQAEKKTSLATFPLMMTMMMMQNEQKCLNLQTFSPIYIYTRRLFALNINICHNI